MRIGTWNLDGRWGDKHRDLLQREACDVWLLTEVNPKAANPTRIIAGYNCHLSSEVMDRKQHWAAVLSRHALRRIDDPHPASAAAIINGVTYCSTILPWRGTPSKHPWVGVAHAAKTESAIRSLVRGLPGSGLVWGGDWNHALKGAETAGSGGGRRHLLAAIDSFNLQVLTADLPHQLGEPHHTIDHIAVPAGWKLKSAKRTSRPRDSRTTMRTSPR